MIRFIYIECYNDEDLLNSLGYKIFIDYEHYGGKSGVLQNMNTSEVSLGIIDEDPGSSPYPQLTNYDLIDIKHNLRIFQNRDKSSHMLLEIPDNLEVWLLRIAELEQIDSQSFGVIDAYGKFKKRFRKRDKNKFFRFLEAISANPSLNQFRELVKEFGS